MTVQTNIVEHTRGTTKTELVLAAQSRVTVRTLELPGLCIYIICESTDCQSFAEGA